VMWDLLGVPEQPRS